MKLLVDGGSTKADWIAIDENGKVLFTTQTLGLNPEVLDKEEVIARLEDKFDISHNRTKAKNLYFYGAGCGTDRMKNYLAEVFQEYFPNATVAVYEDTYAAVYATTPKDEEAIVCILGTGSNSCDYDGEKIIATRPAAGYILGDEGGGCYVGRKFLQDFIHEEMPEKIREAAIERFHITQNIIQDHVYRQPYPSRYMASFCRFITEHKADPYCYGLFYKAFKDFFAKHVCKYQDFQNKPVSFVGSIAFYNSDILRKAAFDTGIQVNIIIESPIAGLTLYHQEKL